jgi:hypothetical protein
MIKFSKDNLFFWRYFFGYGLLLMHLYFIVFICFANFWALYLIYSIFFVGHFFLGKVWRYVLIVDVYLSSDFESIRLISPGNTITDINRNQIVKCTTSAGITNLTYNDKGVMMKAYFMINSKENLKYFTVTSTHE